MSGFPAAQFPIAGGLAPSITTTTTFDPELLPKIVAPLTPADLLVERLVAERPAVGAGQTARKIWGSAQDFHIDTTNSTVTVTPGTEGDPKHPKVPEEIPVLEFEEDTTTYPRTTEKVRVTNPDDDSQYVDVERILTITFRGPDLRPKAAPTGKLGSDGLPTNRTLPFIYYRFTMHNELSSNESVIS